MFVEDKEIPDLLPHLFDSYKGYFTTLKFENNKIYFLDKHIERLKNTAKYLNFDFIEYNFEHIIKQLIQINNRNKARIKIIFYNPSRIKCVIMLSELDTIEHPIRLKTAVVERNSQNYKYKLFDNTENLFYHNKAKKINTDDILFVDKNGYLLEATFSNIFLIYDKRIFTPPDNFPILEGIIRNFLIEHPLPDGFSVVKKKIHYSELPNFEEAFITNSIKGIVPIKQIDKISYQTKKVFSILKRIDI